MNADYRDPIGSGQGQAPSQADAAAPRREGFMPVSGQVPTSTPGGMPTTGAAPQRTAFRPTTGVQQTTGAPQPGGAQQPGVPQQAGVGQQGAVPPVAPRPAASNPFATTGAAPVSGVAPTTGAPVTGAAPQRTATGARPAGTQAPAGAPGAAAAKPASASGGPRKVRVLLQSIDPWSALKLGFLLSIAAGIMLVVAVHVVWTVLNTMGTWTLINDWIMTLFPPGSAVDIKQFFEWDKIMSAATLVAVTNVVLISGLTVISTFLYNIVAKMVGGVYVTLTDD
jgi:hypothetical protein